jgi:uracil-DNA glycosylase
MQDSVPKRQLATLYVRIHGCHICPEMDNEKALRRKDAVSLRTDTFVISQALAETQLRKSGVNFFNVEGEPGDTGENLERFLNQFDRTVYPCREVNLPSGATIPKCKDGFLPVYNTEITQCYPGKNQSGKGDRKPKAREIGNCIGQGFIKEEIELIRPKLLLLMGAMSREAFYKYFLGRFCANNLGEDIASIVRDGRLPTIEVSGLELSVLPIQHASGANPSFWRMLRNQSLIRIIRQTLGIKAES